MYRVARGTTPTYLARLCDDIRSDERQYVLYRVTITLHQELTDV